MYRLIRFGSTILEDANQVDTIGSGVIQTSYLNLPSGGAYDLYGSAQRRINQAERVKKVRLTGATEIEVEGKYLSLLALVGSRDKLYRRTATGLIHWMYARLVEVTAERSYQIARYKFIQDVELHFVCQEATWRGSLCGRWYFDDGEEFDSGLYFDTGVIINLPSGSNGQGHEEDFTVVIGSASDPGRAPVNAIHIQLNAGSGTMPYAYFAVSRIGSDPLESLVHEGDDPIPIGGELVLDTGARSITCTGETDAYQYLTIGNPETWLTLLPGSNTLRFAWYHGGQADASIEFSFYEAWY